MTFVGKDPDQLVHGDPLSEWRDVLFVTTRERKSNKFQNQKIKDINNNMFLSYLEAFQRWANLCAQRTAAKRRTGQRERVQLSPLTDSLLIKLHNSSELDWDRRTGLAERRFCGRQERKKDTLYAVKVPLLEMSCGGSRTASLLQLVQMVGSMITCHALCTRLRSYGFISSQQGTAAPEASNTL